MSPNAPMVGTRGSSHTVPVALGLSPLRLTGCFPSGMGSSLDSLLLCIGRTLLGALYLFLRGHAGSDPIHESSCPGWCGPYLGMRILRLPPPPPHSTSPPREQPWASVSRTHLACASPNWREHAGITERLSLCREQAMDGIQAPVPSVGSS